MRNEIGVCFLAALLAFGSEQSRANEFELPMVTKSTANPYYNAIVSGAEIAARETGGTVRDYGPPQADAQAQIAIFNRLVDRGTAVIAVAPRDPAAAASAIRRATLAGTKVITFDTDSAPDARLFLVNVATADALGRFGAKRLAEELGNRGKIAIVSSTPTSATQTAWVAAFRDELKKSDHSGIEIVDEVYGEDVDQKAFDAAVALTNKYPDLDGIYAPTCPGLPAVARGLESVGKGKGAIKLVGTCVPGITAPYMLSGTVQAVYLWDPIKLGYVTYYAAKYLSEGKIKGETGDSFEITQGKWPGRYEIGGNSEIVSGSPLEFTKENYREHNY
ncbi:substrate-binding domain-containing protein [Xanthomonas hyacinthi]|uniref:Periplasmic binding protein domain-containing protein n=1 Tax=Xanthomonas hyacinthi TaxID=56455 RepID=A0A2S7F1W6_9XANT|nr:substrate-binding domain-containing protein [Xanthomonas hyacinthi]PPU99368.1 hypothetical protein XhyaCFBP1156_03630 [Xanthomonas hyacinthi]QGY78361.1 substrate-binding domain-containing protein [Xanthomonas hyacinthi]